MTLVVKNPPANVGDARRIQWTEEPGVVQSMGPQRVGHDWAPEHIQIINEVVLFDSNPKKSSPVWWSHPSLVSEPWKLKRHRPCSPGVALPLASRRLGRPLLSALSHLSSSDGHSSVANRGEGRLGTRTALCGCLRRPPTRGYGGPHATALFFKGRCGGFLRHPRPAGFPGAVLQPEKSASLRLSAHRSPFRAWLPGRPAPRCWGPGASGLLRSSLLLGPQVSSFCGEDTQSWGDGNGWGIPGPWKCRSLPTHPDRSRLRCLGLS